jgi:hypothetical protein
MDLLARVREICHALPEVTEREEDGYAFSVAGRGFAVYWPRELDDPRPSVWCKAPPGVQDEMITADPEQFFRPAWRSRPDWIGVRLDPPPDDDWAELTAMLASAYRLVAPRRLTRLLDEPRS